MRDRRAPSRIAAGVVRRTGAGRYTAAAGGRRLRVAVLDARIHAAAAFHNAAVHTDIDPRADVPARLDVRIAPDTENVFLIGPDATIDRDVHVVLRGGRLTIGARTMVRSGTVLSATGDLEVGDDALLSWGTIVHCAGRVSLARHTSIGEYTTVVDSAHHFTTPDDWVYHNVEVGETSIGENTWVGAKATITKDVTVGRHCIVAANAVVTRDVPDGHLASGIPAKVRPLSLPWADRPDQPEISES